MIGRNKLPELRIFARAEEDLPLKADTGLSSLVVPNGNSAAACHRWFKYKEAFSSDLLGHVLKKTFEDAGGVRSIQILDPFCGVGTTLLSAQLTGANVHAIGIECNPFAAFAARTKLSWHSMKPDMIRQLGAKIEATSSATQVRLPSLSSITTERCITRHMARQVVLTRDAINKLRPTAERDALTLGLASVIEPVSRIRRDGRALRIVEKSRVVFRELLTERWDSIADDVDYLQRNHVDLGRAVVRMGDGRVPSSCGIADGSIDLILTSPPYPNNIDYNEVYKLELWFLGYAGGADDFLALRRSTFRSHPTCSPLEPTTTKTDIEKFTDITSKGPLADLMGMVIRRVEKLEKKDRRGRTKVLLGYIHDTWQSLQSHFRVLRSGGRAVYVVGNSLHGGADSPYLVPTDLIFATLAREIGFQVEEISIARGLQRRLAGNHFLRDSIVMLRKG
jgi:hypothetical protein